MPKISKVQPSKKSGRGETADAPVQKFVCLRCGHSHEQQKRYFPSSHSPMFRGNGGYLPFCGDCLDEMLYEYKLKYGDESAAMRHMCMKLDIYWHPEIYDMVYKGNTSNSRIKSYISRSNLLKYANKCYDDTLDDERKAEENERRSEHIKAVVADQNSENNEDMNGAVVIPPPTPETIAFWGIGFTPDMYYELNARYEKWTKDKGELDNSAESLYKTICILECKIVRDTIAGKPVEQSANTINTLLGSLNQKPVQKQQDEVDSSFDNMPFGVGIRMCENTRPIPKPKPEFQDVDGIVRYISIWFLGHLCKMLNIRNTYCKLYEDEMARLRVEREVSDEEDDEGAFNDIFGDSQQDSGDPI